ncbi:MAG: flavin reductase [Rhizobiales bacterium]|nr:flavin reductase [Hyphomicrobiales bacterium]
MQDPVISRISKPGRYALPAAEAERFTSAMAMAATAVSVVTTDGAAGKFGLTVSAVSSVSAEPPMVLACINRRSPLAEAVTRNKIFCINLLAASQCLVSDVFAGRASEAMPYDFSCADWYFGMTGAPMLAGAAASFDCNLEAAHDAGTHRIIIGKVLQAATGEHEPLVYARRGYRSITDLNH